jgi:lipoprotein signal peptidase
MAKIGNIALFVVLVSIDQISKYIIRTSGGFYICNKGIAFGLPFPIVYAFVGLLFILFLYNIIYQSRTDTCLTSRQAPWAENFKFQISNYSNLQIIGFIVIVSGSVSNIIDRLLFGCIIDFIDLQIWPVFNFADIFITIGAIMIIYKSIAKQNQKFEL